MFNLIKKYSETNKEKFNKDFIYSREDSSILEYVRDIFKALEIIDEIKLEEITLDTDESSFGPIKNQHKYFKSITESRLDKISYKIRITPSESNSSQNFPILSDEPEDKEILLKADTTKISENSFLIKGDIYINKLIDRCFYINEGVRYFLIYQVVDNATYGNKESVSLKSLLMPITLVRNISDFCVPEFGKNLVPDVPNFDVLLFAKRINPLLYVLGKDAYNLLIKMPLKEKDNIINERIAFRDPKIIDLFNKFLSVDFKFADKKDELIEEGRTIFATSTEKEAGVYFSVDSKKIEERDEMTLLTLGCLLNIKMDASKKKKLIFSYDNLISPWFWIDKLASFFTKNSDPTRRFEKIKTMLVSLERLVDEPTRKILNVDKKDKENTLTIMRYIMKNFEELSTNTGQDLSKKRIRLFEYQLYPLRKYFSDQIYRILNSSTRSKAILDRTFSNLTSMYLIKQTVTSELLRYYNSTNEMDLYTCLLKYTFRGPQSINKQASVLQRDIDPSYTGRLSLIAASSSDPGTSGTIVPFAEIHDYYFEKQKEE